MTTEETRVIDNVRRAISDAEHAMQEPRDDAKAVRHLMEIVGICDRMADTLEGTD